MSLFVKADDQPRKRKRNVNVIPGQPPPVEDLTSPESPQSPPPPLADMFDQDLFGLPGGPDMFCKPEDFYHHTGQMVAPTHMVHHLSSLSIATSPKEVLLGQKCCSVCGRQESKTCKIGHRLQSCKERSHAECSLVCNSCEDFFRRHSGGVNLKERCDATTRDPSSCLGGKSSRSCQFHRYERCIDVGMQPVPAKAVPLDLLRESKPLVARSPAAAAPAPSSIDMPVCPRQTLPKWDAVHNLYNHPELQWRAFCASLSISSSAEMPRISIEDFLAQKIEYSSLLLKYSCEEASAIWHERGSLRLCVESFFTFSPSGAPSDMDAVESSVVCGQPVCVHVDYVAQKQMTLGRDLVPVQVPSELPLPTRIYQAYRSSIPNVVAIIERKEKTTTPPFAAQGATQLGRPLSVSFTLTSKIPGKTWLYVRRAHEKVVTPVVPEQPIEIQHGDVLSIWNELSAMAEHIAWRVTIPQAAL